ncbi:putative RNA-dependent RNA polymerase [Rhizoctonia solani mitovirus 39]|uniref:RNA-dependent RNA polymerase n=1 Tax=Rhizoctonia solani mitovirus 39 TaxID=2720486 RepID=A0ABX6K973_9VIRU|nr:putative RNA-dependent RNA polymerase [Rhizoctonia solani mitovirus 39]QIS79099.1 putative RNA-dependent RNA polymerase [Rhizoctonia solani mitovirus 39]
MMLVNFLVYKIKQTRINFLTTMTLLNNNNLTNITVMITSINSFNSNRFYTTKLNTSKLNTLTISDMNIPKLNIARNQKRLVNTSKAIISFIQTQTVLSENSKMTLISLMTFMENMFLKNPLGYVGTTKMLANWVKVNAGLKPNKRTIGSIPQLMWLSDAHCPNVLFEPMMDFDNADLTEKRQFLTVMMSILEIYNVLLVPKDMTLSTITDPMVEGSKFDGVVNISTALKNIGLDPSEFAKNLQRATLGHDPHHSSASGPNGHALWESHLDAQAILKDEGLSKTIESFCSLVGREEFWLRLKGAANSPSFFKQFSGDLLHSKLHYILEKGDKVRVVAILDWWTQDLLCPLHNTLASFLKKLETDGTFDQDKISSKVREFTANPNLEVFSLDLTAATDRLPVKLQAKILDAICGIEGFGDLWSALLTERDFRLPTGNSVRYSVGQPMGAKSSFPMLALTHHLIVMEAANRALVSNFKDYVVLGDDIVIANRAVADKYSAIMKELGMELSKNKSIWAETGTRQFSIAEICRRLFMDGSEVSALPVRLIANAIDFNHTIYQLQDEMDKRSQILDREKYKYFLASLITNRQGLEMISGLNLLKPLLTGMKSNISILQPKDLIGDLWRRLFSVETFDLIQVFMFTICQEQLKRLGIMVKDTASSYDVIMKAGKLTNATGIGFALVKEEGQDPVLEYKPFINFTPDDMSDWSLTGEFHPAHEVIKADIQRVNTLLMELSVASSDSLISKFINGIVDSLKLAALEMNVDRKLSDANTGRKLLEQTARNIEIMNSRDNQTLSFSVKLDPFNIIWNLKLVKGGHLSVYRSASKVTTTLKDSINKFNNLLK